MRLFLDTSVLLAACGSAHGSSRALFDYALAQRWELLASPWVVGETVRNLPKLLPTATGEWSRLRPRLVVVDDVVSRDRALVFPVAKTSPCCSVRSPPPTYCLHWIGRISWGCLAISFTACR